MSDKYGAQQGGDGLWRCTWHQQLDDYQTYHDSEWGVPLLDEHKLFEKITLEGFQAGLSWLTILRKRERFRQVFTNFDPQKVAQFNQDDVERLLQDSGIIRHRGKINAAIHNARLVPALVEEFGSLRAFFWSFVPDPKSRPKIMDMAAAATLTQTPESKRMSQALRKRGWKFVGPTTCYAFMQSTGIVNDHLESCFRREICAQLRNEAML